MGKKIEIGDILESKHGKYEVLEILPNNKMKIKFLDTGYETECFRTNKRTVADLTNNFYKSKYQIGQILHSEKYGDAEIIELHRRLRKTTTNNYKDRIIAKVKFIDTGYISECEPYAFALNKCRDYLKPNVHNEGILGYVEDLMESGRLRDINEYRLWDGILHRCYDTDYTKENSSYENAEMSDRWKRFDYFYQDIKTVQNYNMWKRFHEEYPNIKNIFEIDKDMLIPNNKLYSSETCMFVPKFINAGYTSLAHDNTKKDLQEYLKGLDYDSIIDEAGKRNLL